MNAELKAIHDRYHGRFATHTEVAIRSNWTHQELEQVHLEDEQLLYSELEKYIEKCVADNAYALLKAHRDTLYAGLPTGDIDAFELLKYVKEHLDTVDLALKELK